MIRTNRRETARQVIRDLVIGLAIVVAVIGLATFDARAATTDEPDFFNHMQAAAPANLQNIMLPKDLVAWNRLSNVNTLPVGSGLIFEPNNQTYTTVTRANPKPVRYGAIFFVAMLFVSMSVLTLAFWRQLHRKTVGAPVRASFLNKE